MDDGGGGGRGRGQLRRRVARQINACGQGAAGVANASRADSASGVDDTTIEPKSGETTRPILLNTFYYGLDSLSQFFDLYLAVNRQTSRTRLLGTPIGNCIPAGRIFHDTVSTVSTSTILGNELLKH